MGVRVQMGRGGGMKVRAGNMELRGVGGWGGLCFSFFVRNRILLRNFKRAVSFFSRKSLFNHQESPWFFANELGLKIQGNERVCVYNMRMSCI